MNNSQDCFKLSKDQNTNGFDLEAGQTWIYPTNYPFREYQYNIIEKALFTNTLVSLPTGLGKTFIAAVVMYNFYRWYPTDKIIFMAPTRPLVKQQLDACYNIMAIPPEVTVELTGTKVQKGRKDIWMSKRIFFITPQILQNDLNVITELGPKIKCLVFDEAHKAKGHHAYCEVVKILSSQNKFFRVLALSATPGNSIADVLEVVKNLQISHIENKNEESPDVKPYVFERSLETVVVPLGEKLEQVKKDYLQILEKYTRTLIQYNVLKGNIANLTKGKVFMTMKEFQEKSRGAPHYNEIMRNLNICMTLFHALELLIRHGLRGFLVFFDEHIHKPLLRGSNGIIEIMENIREYLGPPPDVQPLPDGSYSELPKNTNFGHPKYYKLRDILTEHFSNCENKNESRVIVFFEYRETVREAHALLLQSMPLIKPRIFLGQGSGITQKLQINVVKAFRQGDCNTLLSTSIGEEGLDVGEVDLIVCFDISNKSPQRMIQRMGRTGRKKDGRVIILVTQGKEQEALKECLMQKHNVSNFVFSSSHLAKGFYGESPRMVPQNLTPTCHKLFMMIKKPTLKKNSNLKDYFNQIRNSTSRSTVILTKEEENYKLIERLPSNKLYYSKFESLDEINLNNWVKNLEKQRSDQPIGLVKHTKHSKTLIELMQFADSKRFNLPTSQQQSSCTEIEKKLKQSNIRNMFLNPIEKPIKPINSFNNEPIYIDLDADLEKEISNYLCIQSSFHKNCKICLYLFKCTNISNSKYKPINVKELFIPDYQIFNCLNEENLKSYKEYLQPNREKSCDLTANEIDKQQESEEFNDEDFADLELTEIEENAKKQEKFYETPLNFHNILKKMGQNDERSIGNEKEILSFFYLNSLTDLYEKESVSLEKPQSTILSPPPILTDKTVELSAPKTPPLIAVNRINEEETKNDTEMEVIDLDPVDSEQVKPCNVKRTPKKTTLPPSQRGMNPSPDLFESENSNSPHKLKTPSPQKNNTNGDSLLSPIILSNSIEKRRIICSQKRLSMNKDGKSRENNDKPRLSISDICDLSLFGLDNGFDEGNLEKNENSQKENQCLTTQTNSMKTQYSVSQMLSLINNNKEKITKIKPATVMISSDEEFEQNCNYKSKGDYLKLKSQKPKKSQRMLTLNKAESEKTPTRQRFPTTNSDEEFETTTITPKKQRNKPKIRKKPSGFIDLEAEVSDCDPISQDNDEENCNEEDEYDKSFISDEAQNICTQMQVQYLKSLKSPRVQGKFKISKLKKIENYSEIFSQRVDPQEESEYMNDSFCVETLEMSNSEDETLSELEIMELKLNKRKKKKTNNKITKKRRLILDESSASDD